MFIIVLPHVSLFFHFVQSWHHEIITQDGGEWAEQFLGFAVCLAIDIVDDGITVTFGANGFLQELDWGQTFV